MAEKKKRRPSLSLRAERKVKKLANTRYYDDSDFDNEEAKSEGKKQSKKPSVYKLIVPLALVVVLLISYIFLSVAHPVGVFEYFGSVFASGGSGKGYDVDIFGGKPKYTVDLDNKYYVVTDTSVNCYNRNGKTIFEKSHAYAEPVLRAAETRYILYGQGEAELSVNSLTESLYVNNFDNSIITATICNAGNYAVATEIEGYESVVYVFNKNNKKIYEWYSVGETINSLALSPDGKTLSVATLKVVDGKFCSNIYFFNYNSADPIMKSSYTDDVIYSLYATGKNTVCAAFSDNIEFLDYKKKTTLSNKSEYAVNVVKQVGDKTVVLRNVAANQEQSVIEIFKRNGQLIASFNVNNYITDFSYKSGNLYLLGVSKSYRYDTEGVLCSEVDVNYDAQFIEAISGNNVAFIRNSVIEKKTLIKSGD